MISAEQAADSIRMRRVYARVMERTRREGPVVNGVRCLVFTGARTSHGYGEVRLGKRVVTTHKLVWIMRHGPLLEGEQVLHHCDNPPCIEDAHHFKGDRAANMTDMTKKGRNGRAKLTADQVRELRLAASDGERVAVLVERFSISRRMVFKILSGEAWPWVE